MKGLLKNEQGAIVPRGRTRGPLLKKDPVVDVEIVKVEEVLPPTPVAPEQPEDKKEKKKNKKL